MIPGYLTFYLALCDISDSCCFVNTIVLSVISFVLIKSHKALTFLVRPLYEVDGIFLNTGDS